MNGKDAYEEIQKRVSAAKLELRRAVQLADEHYIHFAWDLNYGMGGVYNPMQPSITRKEALELVENAEAFNNLSLDKQHLIKDVISNTEFDTDSWTGSDEEGWQSSSSYC